MKLKNTKKQKPFYISCFHDIIFLKLIITVLVIFANSLILFIELLSNLFAPVAEPSSEKPKLSNLWTFNDILDDYAKQYADIVDSNKSWTWKKEVINGDNLTVKQKALIKQRAVKNGYILEAKINTVDGKNPQILTVHMLL